MNSPPAATVECNPIAIPSSRRGTRVRPDVAGISGTDVASLAGAALLCAGFAPPLLFSGWSLRYAILIALCPLGAFALWRLAALRDRATLFAIAFLAATVASALLSPELRLSLVGRASGDKSTLIYGVVIGLWACGRLLNPAAVRALPLVIIASLAPSVAVGALQVALDVTGGDLGSPTGRASGLLSNPVFMGSMVAGATAFCGARALGSGSRQWVVAVCFFSFGVGITGSRVALAACVVAIVVHALVTRPQGARVAHTAIGVGVGLVAAWLLGVMTSSGTTVDRVAAGRGDGLRVKLWLYGLEAVQDRPFFGWGMGNYAVAVQSRYATEFASRNGANDVLSWWSDPHNVAVMVLVSTGLIGFSLAAAFAFVAIRASIDRGLLTMFGATAITWLLQPASIHSLPVMMLVLGAASARVVSFRAHRADSSSSRRVARWMLVAGAVLGGYVLIAHYRMGIASDRGDAGGVAAASDWLWDDPMTTGLIAEIYAHHARADESYRPEALEWASRTVDIEGHRPLWWNRLAQQQLLSGEYEQARQSLQRTLELQPTNPSAVRLMVMYAVFVEDRELEATWRSRLCTLDESSCVAPGTVG